MSENTYRRFLAVETARMRTMLAYGAFKVRYSYLFDALAKDLGISREDLARRVGFDPVPEGGNKIMLGLTEPSDGDVERLVDVWLNTRP